jgi:hypothetical protein
MNPIEFVLYVEITASSKQAALGMIDQLIDAVCDIANSTKDEHATIAIWDDNTARIRQSGMKVQ